MPLRIRERPPRKYQVQKPRNEGPTTEKESMKATAGTTRPETMQSLAKRGRQGGRDLGGQGGWKPPSAGEHGQHTRIEDTMNKNYEDHFFKINRGHNRGSVRPDKHMSKGINGSDFFK